MKKQEGPKWSSVALGLSTVIVVVVLATASAFAKGQRKITMKHAVSVNGTVVPAGSYKMTWSAESGDPTVSFVKRKKLVTSAEAHWVDRTTKYHDNSVLYETESDGSQKMIEIRFAGKSQVLVLGGSASAIKRSNGTRNETRSRGQKTLAEHS
ncbi:MAG TPA: hypothetical protein VI455_11340 [Terriglobia bacterium]